MYTFNYVMYTYLFLSSITQLIQLLNSEKVKEPKHSNVYIFVGTLLYRNQRDVSGVALTLAALPMGGDS